MIDLLIVALNGSFCIMKLLRLLLSFDNLMITVLTCGVIAMLYVVPTNFDFLNPVTEAIGDVDLTDMVFSRFRDEADNRADTNIVLINIGNVDRGEIAELVRRVRLAEPAVIGVDAFFRNRKDSTNDSILSSEFSQCKNLVLVSKVAFKKESKEGPVDQWVASDVESDAVFDTLETSHEMFSKGIYSGFANFVIDQEQSYMTCREVSFLESVGNHNEPSFAIKVAGLFNPAAAKTALARGDDTEVINYTGNFTAFYNLDIEQAFEANLSFLKGKIVLLGFMGASYTDNSVVDKFFTPMNHRYVGRSLPDMYGVVIHANIVHMILNQNYIGQMSEVVSVLIGFIVLIINVFLFTYFFQHYDAMYDMVAVATQLSQSILFLFLVVFVFDKFDYKLSLTPALVGVAVLGTVHDLYQDSLKKVILMLIARAKRGKENEPSIAS